MNFIGIAATLLSHIAAGLYMAKLKYNKMITIGVWFFYACFSLCLIVMQDNIVIGFFGMLIAQFLIFHITTQGTAGEKLFLFLTYSNSFCVCLGANLYMSVWFDNVYILNIFNLIIFLLMHIFLYRVLIPKHRKANAYFECGWSRLNAILFLYLIQFVSQYAFSVDVSTAEKSALNFLVFSGILYSMLMVFYTLVEDTAEKNKRVAENRKLKNIVYIDPLTNLQNRTAYREFIKQSKTEYKKNKEAFCLLVVMDIDQFKSINDTYGHIEGDKVLKEVAAILQEYFQAEDGELYRIGGDEFVLVSKTMNAIDVEGHMCAINQKSIQKRNITLSFGCAVVDFKKADFFDVAFEQADKMMYLNKRQKNAKV